MEQSGNFIWKTEGRTGHLIINNPPQNFITTPCLVDAEKMRDWFCDPGVELILVYGQGRHFSAGADLNTLNNENPDADISRQLIHDLKIGRNILETIESSEKPVLAIISGSCLGAGLEIALACHMRIACENSFFGFPEINHGLIPGLNGISRLCRTVGKGKALLLILWGELINACEAESMGLVTCVIPKKNFWNDVLQFTNKILDRSPKAINFAMRSIMNMDKMSKEEAHDFECQCFAELVEDELLENKIIS